MRRPPRRQRRQGNHAAASFRSVAYFLPSGHRTNVGRRLRRRGGRNRRRGHWRCWKQQRSSNVKLDVVSNAHLKYDASRALVCELQLQVATVGIKHGGF